MKLILLFFHRFKKHLILIVLISFSSSIYAKNNDCWIDFYGNPSYKGEHFRLGGPAQLKNLVKVKGQNWDKKIESLIVGPSATLTVFENKNFKLTLTEMSNHPVLMESLGITKQDILEDSEIIFRANAKVDNFGDYNFYHKIRSLRVECVKSDRALLLRAKNKHCWADLFDDTSYKGKHIRIAGPTQLDNLFNLQGESWDKRIESLVVGSKANLTLFEHKNFKLTLTEMANYPVLMKSLGITKQDILENSELIFRANSKVHGFGAFLFYHKIRSLKLACIS